MGLEKEEVRQKTGIISGGVGILLNLILFGIKLLAGFISGSLAIKADAFNNLSDAGSSIVTILGFKAARMKADTEHPYGHGRMEYVSGLVVSMLIILMGYELLMNAFDKIKNPVPIVFDGLTLAILIISILVKVVMFSYNLILGRKIDSPVMKATATDSISDCGATFAVIISTVVSVHTGINIDAYCGILVALMVLWAGVQAAKDTINPLLGLMPSKEYVQQIKDIVLREEHIKQGVIGLHDLMVHDYGPGRKFISLHVEVPSNGDIMELHDLIDNIERDLSEELRCNATIHMDPVLVDDAETNRMKAIVSSVIESINTDYESRHKGEKAPESTNKISFHDFRIVAGPTHTNLLFDIVVPFGFDLKDEEVTAKINQQVRMVNPTYYCVIDVDKTFA